MPATLLPLEPSDAATASGDHPLIVHLTAYPTDRWPSFRLGAAVAVGYHYWDHPSITVVGPPSDAAELTRALSERVGTWISVPVAAVPLLPDGFLLDLHEWAFRWIDRPTGTPAGAAAWLPDDAATAAEIRDLLAVAFPDASVLPHSDRARRWAGIRDDAGRLVACAADATGNDRVGFVASIATLPEHRAAGLGRRVTGWLIDRLVDRHGRASLWVHGDNAPAVAVYDRLGMAELVLASGALPRVHHLVTGDGPPISTAATGRSRDS